MKEYAIPMTGPPVVITDDGITKQFVLDDLLVFCEDAKHTAVIVNGDMRLVLDYATAYRLGGALRYLTRE